MGDFSPGTLLAGRFEILRPLGTGGLAEVLAARDRVTGQEVAIKVLYAHLAREHEIAERFRREMAVTRGLDHPGIVRVFDLHEHREEPASPATGAAFNGRPFFTMELLRGETLGERLKRGPLAPGEARRIARAVCEALQVAHRGGVVHRDLKPQNIFLCEAEEPALPATGGARMRGASIGQVKVLDFGLARVAGWARLTAQSTVMGTPGYIAPELLGGTGADARADVYALGATLFEMLSGQHAFPGSDPYSVLRKQREGAPSPKAVNAAVSDEDDALVRRALDPDPERRFLDVGQLLRELGGEKVPLAPVAPPALVAGAWDVVVHHDLFERKALGRVLQALGAKPAFGWKARMMLLGKNVLVEGASKATAEQVAALCQEHGVGCAVVPTPKRGKVRRWLARNAARIALVPAGGAAVAMFFFLIWSITRVNWATSTPQSEHVKLFTLFGFMTMTASAASFFFVFSILWATLGLGVNAPIERLPEGDPAVRRLMNGIARRVLRLRERFDAAPPATRALLEELIDAGDRMRETAAQIADEAAQIGDALAGPEAQTLPPGVISARDAALGRLLEMAAVLDDALAVQDGPRTSALIAKLRDETAFAREALPQIEAARQGTEAPLPPLPAKVA